MKSTNLFVYFGINFLLVACIGFFLFTTSSCKKEVSARDKFLGIYNASEVCSSGDFTYTMTIAESNISTNAVSITPFGNYDNRSVIATVNGNNMNINDTINDIPISGFGTLSKGTNLSITYNSFQAGILQSCKKTCTK